MIDYSALITKAFDARKNSYSPYSNFCVGAALLTTDNKIYTGCNIENSAYSPTNCAERTAFFKAICEGVRSFKAIAIVGGDKDATDFNYCPPCGVCRQVMMEFCDANSFEIVLAISKENYKIYTLAQLLPESFYLG